MDRSSGTGVIDWRLRDKDVLRVTTGMDTICVRGGSDIS